MIVVNLISLINQSIFSKYVRQPIRVALFLSKPLQLGLDITGQNIRGQSAPDWLKMTSTRTSKAISNSGGHSSF